MIFGEVTRAWRTRIVAALGIEHSKLYHFFQVILTLNLVMIGWVFFRGNSVRSAWYILRHMYVPARVSFFDLSYGMGLEQFPTLLAWAMIVLLIAVDFALVYKPNFVIPVWNWKTVRWAAYTIGVYALVFFGVWERIQFIYFQF
jgi:alginate O-acetyltransferase complex protein AlgI